MILMRLRSDARTSFHCGKFRSVELRALIRTLGRLGRRCLWWILLHLLRGKFNCRCVIGDLACCVDRNKLPIALIGVQNGLKYVATFGMVGDVSDLLMLMQEKLAITLCVAVPYRDVFGSL